MNARISREFTFQAAIHHDDSFIINTYYLELMMDVTTDNIREQNIALERIKFLIDMCLDSCVFVDYKLLKVIDNYTKAGLQVCTLPDEPYDQIIASVLISKFNTITERHLYVTEIRIKSNICDDVTFYISDEEDAEFKNIANVWWTENTPNINSVPKKVKKDKVVQLKKDPSDWNSVHLGWKEPIQYDKGEIVFIPVEK